MAAAESAQTAIDKYFEENKMGVSDIENAELLVTNDGEIGHRDNYGCCGHIEKSIIFAA